MAIRIENQYEGSLPKGTLEQIESAFDSLPREHTRGIERIRLVPFITEPRLKGQFQATELPGLYHPRQGPKGAWLELAVNVLLPADKPFHKKIIPRLSFKSNIVALVFSLVGQHYHLTLKHSLKKTQLEPAVRMYTEKKRKACYPEPRVAPSPAASLPSRHFDSDHATQSPSQNVSSNRRQAGAQPAITPTLR